MELNYEITKNDYVQFYKYHAEYSTVHKKNYLSYKFITPMIVGILMFVLLKVVLKQSIFITGVLILFFLLYYFNRFPKSYQKILRKQALSVLSEKENSSMLGKRKMIMKENKIEIISEHTTSTILNQAVKDRLVFEDMAIIYVSGQSAYAVPMRGLTIEEREEFLKRIKRLPKKMNRNEGLYGDIVYFINVTGFMILYIVNLLFYFKTENSYAFLAMVIAFGCFIANIVLKDK